MRRRDFLAGMAAATVPSRLLSTALSAETNQPKQETPCCGLTYASPRDAMLAPRESLVYLPCLYTASPINKPDYLATVDLDPASKTYSQVIHRLEMPNVGDELHHFGWNACSSCHGDATKMRRFLVIPGLRSGRIHIVDTADPRAPRLHKVIEPEEVSSKTNLSAPHTVHCLANGQIMISMLGNARGEAPGGFLLLDQDFKIAGRWESDSTNMKFNYDFWYQPRHNVMVSSEWGAPNTIQPGFKPEDVKAGKYGQGLSFWDWRQRKLIQHLDLGQEGLIPLEVRFHHDPQSPHGFVGAALSSAIWHWYPKGSKWTADKIIQVDPVEVPGSPSPIPGLITDLVLSLDDRWLYFSNWLHGDIRQYDIRDPAHPKLTGQLWLGGLLGKAPADDDKRLSAGPQMLQLSLDGKRLYVTDSLYSSWDFQFYPDLVKRGSRLRQIDCNTDRGGLSLNPSLRVDFAREPHGPSRAHEMRFPNGDSTSDIWI